MRKKGEKNGEGYDNYHNGNEGGGGFFTHEAIEIQSLYNFLN